MITDLDRADTTDAGTTTSTARHTLRALLVLLLAALPLFTVNTAFAATGVATPNTDHLVAAGPVNSEFGFPSWYQDSTGRRIELCLDGGNAYCGFTAGTIPDPSKPISFPDNFPGEAFYFLASSSLTLPNGGKAALTQGLEGAFANGYARNGDQQVFGRQRIVVKGAPPNAPLRFTTPYGVITIDTDANGAGKVVEDISPAIGNFATPLKSNIAPFLTWDTGPVTDGQGNTFVGNPAVAHKVTGSPFATNVFAVSGGGLNLSNDQFTIQGKISTNTGVQTDAALVSADGKFLDVFATSKGEQLQVDGSPATPMAHDPAGDRFYARLALTGAAPASVTVRNLTDTPVSTSTIPTRSPTGITITKAEYNGSSGKLTIGATSAKGEALTATGVGAITNPSGTDFTIESPPYTVAVSGARGTETASVTITGGGASPTAQPAVTPQPDPGPVTTTEGGTPSSTKPTVTASAAAPTVYRGGTTTLTASSTAGATYKWTQTGGTPVTLSSDTAASPTLTVPFSASAADTTPRPAPTATGPAVFSVVATAGGTASDPATVSVTIPNDTLTLTTARHRVGSELRIDGTSTFSGAAMTLNPATTVVVYDTTPVNGVPKNVKLGTAPVDTTGAWSLRLKPGPSAQVTNVVVQSTRGGTASAVTTR